MLAGRYAIEKTRIYYRIIPVFQDTLFITPNFFPASIQSGAFIFTR